MVSMTLLITECTKVVKMTFLRNLYLLTQRQEIVERYIPVICPLNKEQISSSPCKQYGC